LALLETELSHHSIVYCASSLRMHHTGP
jgi:hypothetical protein